MAWARRILRWQTLALAALSYVGVLLWVRHMVRDPFNVDYLKRYVTLRCSDRLFLNVGRPAPSDKLAELERSLRQCQQIEVEVDGVWGGLAGRPSVRLRVVPTGDGAAPYFAYYAVEVTPLSGTVAIRYELTPALYYLNL